MAWWHAARSGIAGVFAWAWRWVKTAVSYVWSGTKSLWSRLSTTRKWIASVATALLLVVLGVFATKWATDRVEPPYTLAIQSNPDLMRTKLGAVGDFAGYVIPRTPDQIGPPPIDQNVCTSRYNWAHDQGGVDANSTYMDVTVTGNTSDVTRIVRIEPTVISRADPVFGNLITCPGGGEVSTVRPVNIDLDADPPEYTTTDGEGHAIPFAFQVTQGESETFRITANTIACACKWRAVLVLEVDGEEFREDIPANGGYFETTATLSTMSYQWVNGTWTSGESAPEPPKGIKDIPDACALATDADLSAALGGSVTAETRPPGIPAVGYSNGISGQAMYLSTCEYRANTDSNGQFAFVQIDGFPGPGAAKGEFDALSANYGAAGTSGQQQTITGADEALQFDDILIARKGRLVLSLQITPTPTRASFIEVAQNAVAAAGD